MQALRSNPRLSCWAGFFVFLFASAAAAVPGPRIIDLTAHDGTLLKATYFAAPKPGPAVLLLHQCDAQPKLWDVLAERMVASGISVLTLDLRGFGESGGARYDKMTDQERGKVVKEVWPDDIELAYAFLLSQPEVQRDKIGAGGASCGVDNSIQLARRHPEVRSLLLLSGPTNRDGRHFLTSSKLPLFTAVADDDKYAGTVETMQWLYGVSPNPASRFARYSNGGHGAEMFTAHPDLAAVITQWFEATLEGHPDAAPKTPGAGMDPHELEALEQIDRPGGAKQVATMLVMARAHNPKAILFHEAFVNQLGYEHVQLGDTKGAVEIMKLNTIAYPNSPNACDSLSDAYLADGQKDLALLYAKKALELLREDTTDAEARRNGIRDSAQQKVTQLGAANQ